MIRKFRAYFWGILGCALLMLVAVEPTQGQLADGEVEPQTQETSSETEVPLLLPQDVLTHIRDVYAQGQVAGNRADVFSKVGDSLTVSRRFLQPFGANQYDLGEHHYLQAVIDYYGATNARLGNSFLNPSLSAGEGWIAQSALTGGNTQHVACGAYEMPLECEYRVVRPAIAIIMFGTNDAGYRRDDEFYTDMEMMITLTEAYGIIPLLSTIPNRPDVGYRVEALNAIIRELAESHQLPLIDLYALTVDLPNFGLTFDQVHLSAPPTMTMGSSIFTDDTLQYGYVVRNMATLQALYILQLSLEGVNTND